MGGILDDLTALGRLDSSGMLAASAALPGQVRDAWARSRTLVMPETHRAAKAVAVLGMGGSAIGGDLVRGIWSDRLRVPLEVVRGYDLPAWVGPDTLVVASSYSGATEETISAFGQAAQRRAPVAIISTGGTLLDVARRAELPHLAFPGGGQPRAAVGYAVTLLAGLLERAGMLDLGDEEVTAAVATADAAVIAYAPEAATTDNAAKQLAWTIVDRIPVIEASGFLASRRAPLEDAAQREQQVRGRLRGAARGDAQRGRRLSTTGWAPGPPAGGVPGERSGPSPEQLAGQPVA